MKIADACTVPSTDQRNHLVFISHDKYRKKTKILIESNSFRRERLWHRSAFTFNA